MKDYPCPSFEQGVKCSFYYAEEILSTSEYPKTIKATELCFKAFPLDEIADRRKLGYLKHELFIMFGISIIYARLNRSEQAERDLEALWEECRRFDRKWADYFRYGTILRLVSVPGERGRKLTELVYRFAHLVVRFN